MGTCIAVDPGRKKTGLACLRFSGDLVEKTIVPTAEAGRAVETLLLRHDGEVVVCGNGTNHKAVYAVIAELGKRFAIDTALVDEAYTTEEARRRFWQCEPPRGWRKLVPVSFLYPPRPIDDYTAWIIGERFLAIRASATTEKRR